MWDEDYHDDVYIDMAMEEAWLAQQQAEERSLKEDRAFEANTYCPGCGDFGGGCPHNACVRDDDPSLYDYED